MEVEQRSAAGSITSTIASTINTPQVLKELLAEFGGVTSYRALRDGLPRSLAGWLKCRCVLLYQRDGETLQFASGSFDDLPGWSSALLAFAHINPINLSSDLPEACAWRERHCIGMPGTRPELVAIPLIYRQRGIGILVTIRQAEAASGPAYWQHEEIPALEAVASVIALMLENTRLLERDRERIHELSLLNSISSQMNSAMYEPEHLHTIVIQRVREISAVDLCALIEPVESDDAQNMSDAEVYPGWITSRFRTQLLQHFQEQHSHLPLMLERPGDGKHAYVHEYLEQLPTSIQTFFAVPLLSGSGFINRPRASQSSNVHLSKKAGPEAAPRLLGIIVGAYYRQAKLSRDEITLLRVVAHQASAALENMQLMNEVVEARNEARQLLRQVLDDQRLKGRILESIPSGLITTDSNGCITTFNRAAEAILGYHPYEVSGQPLYKFLDLRFLLSPAHSPSATPDISSTRMTIPPSSAWRHVLENEEARHATLQTVNRYDHELVLDIEVLPLHDDPGEHIGLLATFTDVTSLHRLEEEKQRLDRLASLGEMAANVAHEVRNPLASIKTSIQMLRDDLSAEGPMRNELSDGQAEEAQESVIVMLKEVERLDSIVRDLLLFARPRLLHRVQCDICALSDHVLKLIEGQCAEASVVVHRVYAELPPLRVDMGQVEQILLNLCLNALQAMPDGGILTIACHHIPAAVALCDGGDASQITAQKGALAGPYANTRAGRQALTAAQWLEIVVSDTGTGIASDHLERMFQPFFTTKAHGIGLGLAITRRLIEDHGGSIRVESQLGYGAAISVRLPYITETAVPSPDGD